MRYIQVVYAVPDGPTDDAAREAVIEALTDAVSVAYRQRSFDISAVYVSDVSSLGALSHPYNVVEPVSV